MKRRNLVNMVRCFAWALWGLTFFATGALADQFHYNNMILGDRAMGLGGAYAGISDDASGIFYNPAGLAFAMANDFSGSANILLDQKKITYKKTVGKEDFKENSERMFAPFVGGMLKLNNYVDGLVFGWGLYYTDTDLKDQDDLFKNDSIGLRRFHRTANQRAYTHYFAGGAGYRLSATTSIGLTMGYFQIKELVQEYQDVYQYTEIKDKDENGNEIKIPGYQITTQNTRQFLNSSGLEPGIGIQTTVLNKFSLGLCVKKGFILSDNMELGTEARVVKLKVADADVYDQLGGSEMKTTGYFSRSLTNDKKIKNPIGDWPLQIRGGVAWFASTAFLLSFDTTYYSAVTNAGKIAPYGNKQVYKKDAVINYQLGGEYYLTSSLPFRVGAFTNYDARPDVKKNKTDQPDHVDYYGGSVFLAYAQPNSQVGVGSVYQKGAGKAQKIARSTTIQDVSADALTLAISATTNF